MKTIDTSLHDFVGYEILLPNGIIINFVIYSKYLITPHYVRMFYNISFDNISKHTLDSIRFFRI